MNGGCWWLVLLAVVSEGSGRLSLYALLPSPPCLITISSVLVIYCKVPRLMPLHICRSTISRRRMWHGAGGSRLLEIPIINRNIGKVLLYSVITGRHNLYMYVFTYSRNIGSNQVYICSVFSMFINARTRSCSARLHLNCCSIVHPNCR